MTTTEFIIAREALGWSRMELARRMKCAENTVRNMESGKQHIPKPLGVWLARLARTLGRDPIPNWRSARPD